MKKSCSKILIVDDKSANLQVLGKLLIKLDTEVDQANSGAQALKKILTQDYAVLLIDVQMPDMDGYELAQILSKEQSTKHIPIIFVTANYLDEQQMARGYRVGAVDYLRKPINEAMLLSKVRVFLQLHQEKSKLSELSQQHDAILKSAGEGIIGLDSLGNVTLANPAAIKLLGENVIGKNFMGLLSGENENQKAITWNNSKYYASCTGGKTFREDNDKFHHQDGKCFPAAYTMTPVNGGTNDALCAVVVFKNITKQKNLEADLEKLAKTDIVTGLANRVLFLDNLDLALMRAKRHKKMLAVMFLDVDRFKSVNDTLGHQNGDLLLLEFAKRLKKTVRSIDSVARIGGDEFTVILEDIVDSTSVLRIAKKIQAKMKTPFIIGDYEVFIGVSIGIAMYPWCGEDATTLIKNADTAMYRAKDQGRNTYRFFNSNMSAQLSRKVKLENNLHRALERNELQLYYQPKVNLMSGKTVGFEALLRWQHPKLGNITPITFIPLAEDCGLIFPIGEWVIGAACRQRAQWLKAGFSPELTIAVNLSSHQLTQPNLAARIQQVLIDNDTEPCFLELELTESSIMKNTELALRILNELHNMGFSISIDDFGTGYSSLSYLQKLPVKSLKIDQSFIKDISENVNDAIIVKAIVSMADSLELNVIAEGIETLEQLTKLQEYHCQQGQGFHFSKPLPADRITALYSPHNQSQKSLNTNILTTN